jgi:hypothetical protein
MNGSRSVALSAGPSPNVFADAATMLYPLQAIRGRPGP